MFPGLPACDCRTLEELEDALRARGATTALRRVASSSEVEVPPFVGASPPSAEEAPMKIVEPGALRASKGSFAARSSTAKRWANASRR